MDKLFLLITMVVFLSSCSNREVRSSRAEYPPVYPDYTDVTIPVNVAPLNFMMRDPVEKMVVTIAGAGDSLVVRGKKSVRFPERRWRKLLLAAKDNLLWVTVSARFGSGWVQYKPFSWSVKGDSLDPWLSYRLIEPGYEVWHKISIQERNTESFKTRPLADNNLTGNSCMNCHIRGNSGESLSMFHLRGPDGGTVLSRGGELRKLESRNDSMWGNATYGNFHPSGRYAVFSVNNVIPAFHAWRSERLEVYDSRSDLVVFDFDKMKAISLPWLDSTIALETFPVFSADGQWIYFCSAPFVDLPDSIRFLRYSIVRIPFDAVTGIPGQIPETLWDAGVNQGSASFLKTSPDGKYLLFTRSDYGTFPIWHQEADLQMMNLSTGVVDSLKAVNAWRSDSYHSWSSNSRWFVFASKRDDGIYGKPYFSYVDTSGKAYKPFVLPQRDPSKYDQMLKSFNIPELGREKTPFTARDIEHLYWNVPPEPLK